MANKKEIKKRNKALLRIVFGLCLVTLAAYSLDTSLFQGRLTKMLIGKNTTLTINAKSNPVNSAEFFKLVMDQAGTPLETDCTAEQLPDVPEGAWYQPYACTAYKKGLVGMPSFSPMKQVNRAEAAKLFAELYNLRPAVDRIPAFSDVPNDQWYAPGVKALKNSGILRGDVYRTFYPAENLTHASLTQWLSNAASNSR